VWLRPVHRWFFFWEDLVLPVYRVVAVAIGAAITAAVVVLGARVRWLVAAPLVTAGWIALGVVQEHDQRVLLDGEFLDLLREHADPVLARTGFTFRVVLTDRAERGPTGLTRSCTKPPTRKGTGASTCGSAAIAPTGR